MTAPNRDLEQAGWTLQQIVAVQYTAALEHLHRELSALDGYPTGGGSSERVSGGGARWRVQADEHGDAEEIPVTGTEQAAVARMDLWAAGEGLRLAQVRLLTMLRELNDLCNQTLRMRQPKVITKPEDQKRNLCCSGQSGLHAQIEWGDPLCMMPAVKKGLCQKHYDAWRYARRRDGISTDGDYQPTGNQFHPTHT